MDFYIWYLIAFLAQIIPFFLVIIAIVVTIVIPIRMKKKRDKRNMHLFDINSNN